MVRSQTASFWPHIYRYTAIHTPETAHSMHQPPYITLTVFRACCAPAEHFRMFRACCAPAEHFWIHIGYI